MEKGFNWKDYGDSLVKEVKAELDLLYRKVTLPTDQCPPFALVGQVVSAGNRAGSLYGLEMLRDKVELTPYGEWVLERWMNEYNGKWKV